MGAAFDHTAREITATDISATKHIAIFIFIAKSLLKPMKADKFWGIAWVSFAVFSLASFAVSATIFMVHIKNVNAAAVGISFDPSKDPFETALRSANFSMQNGSIYQDALPLGLSNWNWDSTVDWSSSEQVYSGAHSFKVAFTAQWGGMGVSGFKASQAQYNGISLDLFPDTSVGDLYVEVYDQNGTALTRQSIGFYAPSGQLTPNVWQTIVIPLQNLTGGYGGQITGLSISTTNPGTVYVDDISFVPSAMPHAVWVQPQWVEGPPFNPFATSTPAKLPYNIAKQGESLDRWYAYNGSFANNGNGLTIGPLANKNNDALAIYRGGAQWDDYEMDTITQWGLTSTFSLLARFKDPQNYVSCSYSYYGQTAQIYDINNGISSNVATSPTLPTPYDEAWKDVKAGIRVEGSTVSCLENGSVVLKADLSDMPRVGTVGLEAWDQNTQSSPHTVTSLTVSPLGGE